MQVRKHAKKSVFFKSMVLLLRWKVSLSNHGGKPHGMRTVKAHKAFIQFRAVGAMDHRCCDSLSRAFFNGISALRALFCACCQCSKSMVQLLHVTGSSVRFPLGRFRPTIAYDELLNRLSTCASYLKASYPSLNCIFEK